MKKIISILMCVIFVALSTNTFAQEASSEIKERIKKQKETSKYQMTDTIAVKPVNPDDCESILSEALTEYEYIITKYHDTIKTYTVKFNSSDDADKAVDILNERDDIIYAQNDYYGGEGTPIRPFEPILPKPRYKELSKTYEIGVLNQNGIIVGDPDGDLRESDEITRAEFAAVLCRAMGCEDEAVSEEIIQKQYFPDVSPKHWAAGYVNFAYENGAISGFLDGNFYPGQNVTNEQVIKMLIGAWGYTDEAEANGGYPNGYMKVAKEHGVLDTIDFNYKNASKRWVASVFVYGVLSIEPENEKIKQPVKTQSFTVDTPREENDTYVERPEEILKNVSKESSIYERTLFEQTIPNNYLPIEIADKSIKNVWYRDFSIGINFVNASDEGFNKELAVGESVDLSGFANGEYNIIVGYNDGKIDDYSFGKIFISDNGIELSGLMYRYTSIRDIIQFEKESNKVSDIFPIKNMENMKFMAETLGDNYGDVFISNLSEEDIKKICQVIGQLKLSDEPNDDKRLYFSISDNEKVYAYDSRIGFIIDAGDKTVTKKYIDYNEFINALKDNGLDRWHEPGGVPERGNMMSTKIETSDEDSTEVFVGQVVENYSIDNIRTIYIYVT